MLAARELARERKRAYNRAYVAAHREERAAYDLARYKADPEGERARKRIYRAANLEKKRAQDRAFYAANRVEIRRREAASLTRRAARITNYATKREKYAVAGRAYRKAHPEYFRVSTMKRNAVKLGAAGYSTPEQVDARWAMWGDKCWICGAPATCTDHVKPLTKHGSNWPANLRPACGSCNSRKGNRWPFHVHQ